MCIGRRVGGEPGARACEGFLGHLNGSGLVAECAGNMSVSGGGRCPEETGRPSDGEPC